MCSIKVCLCVLALQAAVYANEPELAGLLTYADVCGRMLTYAHVCSRMLTYADVCSAAGERVS